MDFILGDLIYFYPQVCSHLPSVRAHTQTHAHAHTHTHTQCWIVGWLVNDRLERTWTKQSQPNMRYCIRIFLEGMRKTTKTSAMIVGFQTDIWAQDNLNMKLNATHHSIPCCYRNLKIHYLVHKSWHLDPSQSQSNLVPMNDSSRIPTDIIRTKSLIWPLPLRLPHQTFIHICSCYHECYKSHPAHHRDDNTGSTSLWMIYLQN
jgi:hypothetical protein